MAKILALQALMLLNVLMAYCQPLISLQQYVTGFNGITDIANAGDGRLYIAEQMGYIRIVQPNGTVLAKPFLDIKSKVTPNVLDSAGEQGLLGIAFSPNYAADGYFYVNYTNKSGIGNTVIARYRASPGSDTADAASGQILLTQYQPYRNHNGGSLKFGNDGYLYVGLGDGGSGGDPGNRAQNLDSLLGKILRIDVSGGGAYTIPPSNPYATSSTAAHEVWASGLRNPWRFSFDRHTHNLWIADVGQDTLEEINVQSASSTGGENYGWRCYEGHLPFNTSGCGAVSNYVAPVYDYGHIKDGACSVTGGFVYRGSMFPSLQGYYFYADFCNGTIYSLSADGNYTNGIAGVFNGKLFSTFGEDDDGELYIADRIPNTIYRIADIASSVTSYTSNMVQSRIYPSPNNGTFTIEYNLTKDEAIQIDVTDASGRLIESIINIGTKGRNLNEMQLNDMAPGIYFLQLKTDRQNGQLKFTVIN